MSKRILALLLCAVMLIPCLAACAKDDEDNPDPGAYITMYLTDEIYDFDPANAIYNKETQNVLRLIYDTLFVLDKNGKVKNSQVKKYTITENTRDNEYYLMLTLRDDIFWSNGDPVTSDNVVYTFKRLLNSNNSFAAASLLYDVKNARAVKEGDCSIDDIGIEAVEEKVVKIIFEGKIDYDQFLLNLTNIATAPLHETYVNDKNEDWAKKASSVVGSSSFKLGKIGYEEVLNEKGNTLKISDDRAVVQDPANAGGYIVETQTTPVKTLNFFYLERNLYYQRDTDHDSLDASVTPYRLLVDCTKSDEDLLKEFKNGKLFYMGDIPMSIRTDSFVKENVETFNALSTFVCSFNQNALIDDGGEGAYLFKDANVRKALSLALDRKAIAKAVVYAEAATGLVAPGIFEGSKVSKNDFRTTGGVLINSNADLDAAKALLDESGINPSDYTFTIRVSAEDDVNVAIAYMIQAAWNGQNEDGSVTGLGFNVAVEEMLCIENNDYSADVGDTPRDICDDRMTEAIRLGNYEVAAFDYNAFSVDAFSMLSNFAFDFSGMAMTMDSKTNEYYTNGHITGYNNQDYNDLIEAIFYIPYYATLTEESSDFLGIYDSAEEFKDVYERVGAVYEQYGIKPTTDASGWSKQKARLLHYAEELLIKEDMALIPVVFNQNAILVGEDLSRVNSDYYSPATFRKTKLKDYEDYQLVFKKFPNVDWSMKGKKEDETDKK